MSTFLVNPLLINLNNRFDVMLKYMFVKSHDMNFNTSFYEDAYKNHLKVWNNFVEYNNPDKDSYEKFRDKFYDLIDSIRSRGYDPNCSPAPVLGNNLLNGSHRAAACLYYTRDILCRESDDQKDGQLDCSWYFFKSLSRDGHMIDPWCADQAALEFVELFDDVKVVCLFPSAVRQGGVNEVRRALRESFGVFYEKEIVFSDIGRVNLMKELYHREAWAESNGGAGYHEKSNLCYGNSDDAPTHFFLVRMSVEQAVDCKEKIRSFYNVGKHSIHINDTWDEAKRISRAVFNANSIHFLNHARPTKQFEDFLQQFRSELPSNHLDYCITASMIMAAYGLREAKDVDYLHRDQPTQTTNSLISSHNQYLDVHYHEHVDNLVMNPRNHFYCHGVKLISLDALRRMKKIRDEEKDRTDIIMIQTLANEITK